MTIDSDRAAMALVVALEYLGAAAPEGWTQRDGGALAAVTTVPLPTLNGVLGYEVAADRESVSVLLDRVASSGLPHCLQLRPGCDPSLADLANQRGMRRDQDVPLMVLDDPGGVTAVEPADLVIRQLRPEQVSSHTTLAAEGFEAPREYFDQLMSAEVAGGVGVRCYLGEIQGEPVTTGVGLTLGDCVGIFSIATPPAHRRHGYGAAVTARAVRDGLRSGATWAWLQSSPSGHSVYRSLGFRTIESWACWISIAE